MLLSSITIPRSSSLWRSSRETIALFAPHVWDAATELDPAAEKLDQTRQFSLCHPDRLREFFEGAGLADVRSRACKAVIHCLLQLGNFAVPITTNNTQSLIQPAILRRSALSRSGENAAKRPPRLDMTGGFRPAGPLIVAAATDSDV